MDDRDRHTLRRRSRVQMICAIVFAVLTLAALIFPVWIEELTDLFPDNRNGTFELLVAVPFGLASCVLGFLAVRTKKSSAVRDDPV
jgi:hypothetical protein